MANEKNNETPVVFLNTTMVTKPWGKDDIFEKYLFNGEYAMEFNYINPILRNNFKRYHDLDQAVNCKSVYVVGNILYKKGVPNIWSLVDLMIEATYEKKLSVPVDTSVNSTTQILGGTICPTKIILFKYDGKIFTIYGRYIYGYDLPYIRFENPEKPKGSGDEDDDSFEDEEEEEDEDKPYEFFFNISKEEVVLPSVDEKQLDDEARGYAYDYNYTFTILDAESQELIACCLYR